MIPSNLHPTTATRRTRRALLLQAACGLVAALLAAPGPAHAQSVIQFCVGLSEWPQYQVGLDRSGNVTNQRTLEFSTNTPRVYATARSDYPVGRQYLYSKRIIKADGSWYMNLMAWGETTKQSKAVTDI